MGKGETLCQSSQSITAQITYNLLLFTPPFNKLYRVRRQKAKCTRLLVVCDRGDFPAMCLKAPPPREYADSMEKPGLQADFKPFSANVGVLGTRWGFAAGGRCRHTEALRTESRSPGASYDQIPTVGGTQSSSSRDGVDGLSRR